ncbi:MAG: GcrA family cell cycle regulator [Methylocella sp.]
MLYGSVGPRPRKDYSCKINGRAASNHPASTYINPMKTLYELERSSCRWPIADLTLPGRRPGSRHLFCGKPAAPGKPYCREHAARAFQPLSLQNRGRRQRQGRAQTASSSASKPKACHNLFGSLGGLRSIASRCSSQSRECLTKSKFIIALGVAIVHSDARTMGEACA